MEYSRPSTCNRSQTIGGKTSLETFIWYFISNWVLVFTIQLLEVTQDEKRMESDYADEGNMNKSQDIFLQKALCLPVYLDAKCYCGLLKQAVGANSYCLCRVHPIVRTGLQNLLLFYQRGLIQKELQCLAHNHLSFNMLLEKLSTLVSSHACFLDTQMFSCHQFAASFSTLKNSIIHFEL